MTDHIDYEDRREKIQHKKISQNRKLMYSKCLNCGRLRVNHLNRAELLRCDKLTEKANETVGRIATNKEIGNMRLSKT